MGKRAADSRPYISHPIDRRSVFGSSTDRMASVGANINRPFFLQPPGSVDLPKTIPRYPRSSRRNVIPFRGIRKKPPF